MICTFCGHDVTMDGPITIGDFRMEGPKGPMQYRGKRVVLTKAEKAFCWAIMGSYPRPISKDALLSRIDSDTISNVADVIICRIRAKFTERGAGNVIRTEKGVGYAWEIGA